MTLGTPHSRRALRMYVKVTGPKWARGGHTRQVDGVGGFVACDPAFSAGDGVEMELMLNPRTSAGVKVEAEVVSVSTDPARGAGVELRWRVASTSKSPSTLTRFLVKVLGLADPAIVDDGVEPYRYRHTFSGAENLSAMSMLEAMKSRPRVSRRTVMKTDPMLGPAKLQDVIGPLLDAAPEVALPSRQLTAAIEDEFVEDELCVEDPQPSVAADRGPVTQRGGREDERRARPRIVASVPVSFFVNSRGTVARAHNVSRAGLYLETSEAPPVVGSRVNVRFPVLGGSGRHVVLLTCEVARHRNRREKPGTRHGFAVVFRVVDELGRTGIFSHFIRQHL